MAMPYSINGSTTRSRVLQVVLAFIFMIKSLAVPTFDVVQLGAKPDGKTDSKPAFEKTWGLACGSSKPEASIRVPKGTFLLSNIRFRGPCKNTARVSFEIAGTIVASGYSKMRKAMSWLEFDGVDGVSIDGGKLDGRGGSLWKCKASSGKNCPNGATTLAFYNSKNIHITGLTSQDSEFFHIAFVGCKDIKVLRATISAPGNSPNTDGIHVESSTDVSILHSTIGTGDDCISIGPGSSSLWIEDVHCGPGHGISIGSLGKSASEKGVSNVTVTSATFKDTQNGVRIKTWAKPSQSSVRNVLFQHATMDNVQNPIIIDQNYCPGIPNCPQQSSGINITDIRYIDIHGTSATEVAMKFDCSRTNPCKALRLRDINLTYNRRPAKAWCSNASGEASGEVKPHSCFK